MKKIVLILVIILCFQSVSFASTREELYRCFGPQLIEAIVRVIKNEINILRNAAGLPERNDQQLIDAIKNMLDATEKYDWLE